MTNGFNPGDVVINNLTLISPRSASWNMAPNFLSGSVIENIYLPGIVASLDVIDFQDYIGKLQLAGDEQVSFTFSRPNASSASYLFHLNSIEEIENQGAVKAKTYKLQCVSREALTGQGNHVQQNFNTQISSIVSSLFGMLGSNLSLNTEQTQGVRNINIPNKAIYHAIEDLRKEAISSKNLSSNFMFFFTKSGAFFKTIEGLMRDGSIKSFTLDNTMGHNINSDFYSNILSIEINKSMDAMNRITSGSVIQRVSTFNPHTNEFIRGDFKPNVSSFFNLGSQAIMTDAFKQLFSKANKSVLYHINPNQKTKVGKTYIPDNIAYKMLNLSQMQEQSLRMTVLGDPILEAGKTVTLNIPEVVSSSYATQLDIQNSGNWLISKLEHSFKLPNQKPRYTINAELIKGMYNS